MPLRPFFFTGWEGIDVNSGVPTPPLDFSSP